MLKSIKKYLKSFSKIHNKHHSSQTGSLFPAGHFHSPLVDLKEIQMNINQLFTRTNNTLKGIDLNTTKQLNLLKEFNNYYIELPFKSEKTTGCRYYFENDFYSYSDGIILYSFIRHWKPKKIIEVGSGFSSALMLDVNNMFFKSEIDLTFIEPYPTRLNSLLSTIDLARATIIENRVQQVQLAAFEQLGAGDILFIDSSHVAKTGSDVNFILFEILPSLQKGVLIHFHDIFFPFEYPPKWVLEGRNWNENYFLRSFLMYNTNFSIRLFTHYLHLHHAEAFTKMPLAYKNFGGNIWIEKKQ